MATIPSRAALRARAFAAGFAAVLLGGCGGGMADLDAYVDDIKARPATPLEPLPVMQQFETFEYAAQDLRDPFSNPTAEQSESSTALRPDPDRPKEPLEAFPLDGLDMVGTLGEGDTLIGLVMDPERVIHRVNVGNYMGQTDGHITAIHEDRIELIELAPDGNGGWIERRAEVALDD
jgi:type IV pilus assembly protein PilP